MARRAFRVGLIFVSEQPLYHSGESVLWILWSESFTSLMRLLLVSYCIDCAEVNVWFSPFEKDPRNACGQPFGWEVSTSHVKLAFLLWLQKTAQIKLRGSTRFWQNVKDPSYISSMGISLHSVFFCWKIPIPCRGGSVPTNDSLQQRQPEGRRGWAQADDHRVVFVPYDSLPHRA